DQQRRDGRDARVDERAEQLLVVIAHRLGEVRELPGELEAGERPRLQRLVAEKAEGNGEEEPQPDDPGQEQHPRRQPSMPMEPPHALPRAYWPSTLCHFEIWSSLLSAFESYWWTVESTASVGKMSGLAAVSGSVFARTSFAPFTGVT